MASKEQVARVEAAANALQSAATVEGAQVAEVLRLLKEAQEANDTPDPILESAIGVLETVAAAIPGFVPDAPPEETPVE